MIGVLAVPPWRAGLEVSVLPQDYRDLLEVAEDAAPGFLVKRDQLRCHVRPHCARQHGHCAPTGHDAARSRLSPTTLACGLHRRRNVTFPVPSSRQLRMSGCNGLSYPVVG